MLNERWKKGLLGKKKKREVAMVTGRKKRLELNESSGVDCFTGLKQQQHRVYRAICTMVFPIFYVGSLLFLSAALQPSLAVVWICTALPSSTELFAAWILNIRSGVSERSGSEEDLGVCSQAGSVWFHTYRHHHTHTPASLKKQTADCTTCYWERGNINMLIIPKMLTQS